MARACHSARRSSGSDDSGTCTRSLHSARVVLSRLAATRKSWRFPGRSNGTRGIWVRWVTMVVSSRKVEDRRRCRLFGTRPVSREDPGGNGADASRSGCRDPEEEGTLHLYTAVA